MEKENKLKQELLILEILNIMLTHSNVLPIKRSQRYLKINKKNYVMRDARETETLRKNDRINKIWDSLTPLKRDVIQYISSKGTVVTNDLINYTNRSRSTVIRMLKEFEDMNLIE